jgi:hypothetical protein
MIVGKGTSNQGRKFVQGSGGDDCTQIRPPPVNWFRRAPASITPSFRIKTKFLSTKPAYYRDLSNGWWITGDRFPVFFPVSRELWAEKSSQATASTATQSKV